VKLKVDEVVTTLLMNSIIMYFVSFLLNGPWRSPVSGWPQSPEISEAAHLPRLFPRSRLHIGFLIALLVVVIVYILIKRTPLGLKMRATGASLTGARFARHQTPTRTMLTAALVSGAYCRPGSAVEIGGIHFHLN